MTDLDAFFHGLVLAQDDAVGLVVLYLPAVLGVDLLDVDDVEIDAVSVAIVDFIEERSLRSKRRSSIATEDQGHGALSEMI